MNRRNIIFSLIAVIAIIVFSYSWYFTEPPLTVHLRCDKNISGTLQVDVILPIGKLEKTKSFDINNICKNGEFELDNFQREKRIKFTFKYSHNKKAHLTSEYGKDIQSDQNGYYMILKVTNTSPFIANDRI